MKKILLTLVVMTLCIAYGEQTLQQKLLDTCKKMQIQDIADAKKISQCLSNQFIIKEEMITKKNSNMLGTGYMLVGVEQGKCHYKKVDSISITKMEFKGDCYAPLSVMSNYAGDRIKFANKMCNSTGFANIDDTTLAGQIRILESYCK